MKKLIFIPKGINVKVPIPDNLKDFRFWVLLGVENVNTEPSIPKVLLHHKNAFMEDRMHDYDVRENHLRYFGSFTDKDKWVVLETFKTRN